MITRRSFSVLLAASALGTFVTTSTPAAAEGALKFELYADKAGEFRWRLKAGNGETLATSGEGYKAKASAASGIARIKADVNELPFELYEDAKKETRWRLKAKNGQVIAASSEGYKARSDAERAIASIKDGAKGARVDDQT